MNTESRKLATVAKIENLEPIVSLNKETGQMEVAENIQLATVRGWKCVTLKSEFSYVGEPCVYFEIDAIIPRQPWNSHIQKDKPDKDIRLKTIKLRGQLSQGLALPVSILEDYGTLIFDSSSNSYKLEIEDEKYDKCFGCGKEV